MPAGGRATVMVVMVVAVVVIVVVVVVVTVVVVAGHALHKTGQSISNAALSAGLALSQ